MVRPNGSPASVYFLMKMACPLRCEEVQIGADSPLIYKPLHSFGSAPPKSSKTTNPYGTRLGHSHSQTSFAD